MDIGQNDWIQTLLKPNAMELELILKFILRVFVLP